MRAGRSVIIVVNKWDLVTTARTDDKPPADRNIFEEQVRHVLKYLDYAPIVFLSAAHRTNLHRLYEAITLVATRAPQARLHRPDEPLPRSASTSSAPPCPRPRRSASTT